LFTTVIRDFFVAFNVQSTFLWLILWKIRARNGEVKCTRKCVWARFVENLHRIKFKKVYGLDMLKTRHRIQKEPKFRNKVIWNEKYVCGQLNKFPLTWSKETTGGLYIDLFHVNKKSQISMTLVLKVG